MAKILTYVIILTFIFAGITVLGFADTNTSKLIQSISGGDSGFKLSDLWAIVFGSGGIIAGFGIGAAITIGIIRNYPIIQTVLASFIALLVGWIGVDLITIRNTMIANMGEFSAIGTGISVLIAALLIGAVISGIQFWMGNDL